MLCRIILTAITISYVICVLLLSGLQKEDLDANTLAKLQRHNVNIHDMNNETLRQECLSKSYIYPGKDETKTYDVTEDPNDTSKASRNSQYELSTKLPFRDNLNVDKEKSKIETPEMYVVDKTKLRYLLDEMKADTDAQTKHTFNNKENMGNVTERAPDNIKDQHIEYFRDHPSLDSVMKFWAKLANKDSTNAFAKSPTTHSPPPTVEKLEIITSTKANMANAQTKDIEYVSKIIAEYLRSQTTPTTTEASKIRTKNIEIVSRTIKEFLEKNSKTDSTTVPKKIENIFSKDLKELSDLTDIGKLFEDNTKEDERTPKPLRMQQKENNDDSKEKLKRSEITLFSSLITVSPRAFDSKSEKKMEALKYLNNMLKVNNKFSLNGPLFSMEISTQDSVARNKDYENLNIQQILHEYDARNASSNNSVPGKVHSTELVKDKDGAGTVSADLIKEIAEKVKEIVMRDLKKEVPTTERVTSCLTVTTPASTTVPEYQKSNQSSVLQTFMDLLKELNKVKVMSTTTTGMPIIKTLNVEKYPFRNLPPDLLYAPVMGGFNPYILKTPISNIKQFDINPYSQNLVPIPFATPINPPLYRPTYAPRTTRHHKSEYKAPPLTIQTNSAEIPPLVIQVLKPTKVMNQHIIVTTQNPFQKQRDDKLHRENKQRWNFNYAEPLHVSSERSQLAENPTYADLAQKLRVAENVKKEFRDSYKDKIEKIKERIERNRDKTTELRHPIETDRSIGLSDLDKSNHYVNRNLHASNYHNPINRESDSNRQEHFNRPMGLHHRQLLDQLRDRNNENLNHADDSSYRDIITREFLSRLVDSNHHDVISQLVDPNIDIRRPIDLDRQSQSHLSDAYERYEHERSHPRHKATKFHEQLEQMENLPQNNYEAYSKTSTKGCCNTVNSRQQMPLNKVKERPKFDDSHFKNFLQSQQKVTDMLERILAAKSKSKKRSSETQ